MRVEEFAFEIGKIKTQNSNLEFVVDNCFFSVVVVFVSSFAAMLTND